LGQQGSVLRAPRTSLFHWVTVTLTAVSWLALSHHCALGLAAVESHNQQEAAEQHDCCANDAPSKPRPAKDPTIPCCKTLPATAASLSKAYQPEATILAASVLEFVTLLVSEPPRLSVAVCLLDTGPPGKKTFAESVLQESLLAHAPPVLA
jgi:hypothetical protein